jgi:hypothetical protein
MPCGVGRLRQLDSRFRKERADERTPLLEPTRLREERSIVRTVVRPIRWIR